MRPAEWFYEAEMPSRRGTLVALYPRLHDWSSQAGMGIVAQHRVAVAVTEAVTNAIVHAHAGDETKTISVRLGRKAGYLIAEIGDQGNWDGKVPPPPGSDHWEQSSGRGFELMRQLTHTVSVHTRPGGGTLVRLTFLTDDKAPLQRQDTKRGSIRNKSFDTDKGGYKMDCRVESFDNVDVMRLSGRIDLVTSNTIKDSVRERLHAQRTFLVLNMEGVDFINSSGLGAMVSILKDVRLVNGRLVLSNLAPYVQEIFDITQLSNVFEIFPTEKNALASFHGHAVPTPSGA